MYNGMYINPAYAGSKEALSVDLLYRNQWVGFNGSPTTTILSAHAPLKNENIAIGGMIFNDAIGIESNTGIYGNYAYRVKNNGNTLSLGLSGGMDFLSENWNEVISTEGSDPQFNTGNNNILPNFSFGSYYYNEKYFIGFSMPFFLSRNYINQNKVTVKQDLNSTNLILEGGLNLKLNDDFSLKPSTLLKVIPGIEYQIDLNLLTEYKRIFGFGGSYRTNTAIIAMIYFNFQKNFTLSYAYDYNVGKNSQYFGGSHEIYLRYIFKQELNAENPRYF